MGGGAEVLQDEEMSSFRAAINPRIDPILWVRHSQILVRKSQKDVSRGVATTHRVCGIAHGWISDPVLPVLEGVESDKEEGKLHRRLTEDEGLEPQGRRNE